MTKESEVLSVGNDNANAATNVEGFAEEQTLNMLAR